MDEDIFLKEIDLGVSFLSEDLLFKKLKYL
jgi:hypothetical protein